MEKNGLTRIYFKEMLKRINKKDIRSVVAWCNKNHVEIYSDSSGKFVIQAEFNLAYNKPIINNFKARYGENWVQMYELCLENKLHLADSKNERISASKGYTPKSKASSEFLNNFK